MPQFSAIAQYYHLLFPAREAQLNFLTELAGPPPARVFDVASGVGEYTAALSARGYDCFGIDLDLQMHACAKARHPELAERERLVHGDMLELSDLVRGPARLAFCIGNSLAQLGSDAQVYEALLQLWELTRPGGVVALQLVNFDRILRESRREDGTYGDAALPTLEALTADAAPLVLERRYDLQGAPQRIVFHTRLAHPGGVAEAASPLLCLTRERLEALLPSAARAAWYGGFSGTPWSDSAQATVCVLR